MPFSQSKKNNWVKAIKAQPGTEDLTEEEITKVFEDCFDSPPFPYLSPRDPIPNTNTKPIETAEELEQHISNMQATIDECEKVNEEMSRPHPNALARAIYETPVGKYLSVEETVKIVRESVEKNRQLNI
jgi:hypothetical protein